MTPTENTSRECEDEVAHMAEMTPSTGEATRASNGCRRILVAAGVTAVAVIASCVVVNEHTKRPLPKWWHASSPYVRPTPDPRLKNKFLKTVPSAWGRPVVEVERVSLPHWGMFSVRFYRDHVTCDARPSRLPSGYGVFAKGQANVDGLAGFGESWSCIEARVRRDEEWRASLEDSGVLKPGERGSDPSLLRELHIRAGVDETETLEEAFALGWERARVALRKLESSKCDVRGIKVINHGWFGGGAGDRSERGLVYLGGEASHHDLVEGVAPSSSSLAALKAVSARLLTEEMEEVEDLVPHHPNYWTIRVGGEERYVGGGLSPYGDSDFWMLHRFIWNGVVRGCQFDGVALPRLSGHFLKGMESVVHDQKNLHPRVQG